MQTFEISIKTETESRFTEIQAEDFATAMALAAERIKTGHGWFTIPK